MKAFAVVFLLIILANRSVHSEVTRIVVGAPPEITPDLLRQYPSLAPIYQNRYPPRTNAIARNPDYTERFNTADSYANSEWLALGTVNQGEYLMSVFEALNKLHGFNYSPRIMTCLSYRESEFRPQVGAYSSDPAMPTTALGLTQVTQTTAVDMIDRFGFQPQVYGYVGSTGEEYFQSLSGNMILQMEAAMGVMYLKNGGDKDPSNIIGSLQRYYGTSSNSDHNYAQAVYDCAICIRDEHANRVHMDCLKKAKAAD